MRRVISLLPLVAAASAFTVLYIPLDERFTTRFAFLNLAQVTPFTVLTPPMDIISSERVPAPLDQLDAWVEANMPLADAAVISLELYVYGGLINSRISNDSSAFINSRVMKLVQLTQQYPNVAMHVAGVVMRIPSYSYSPPVEEPWYWAFYGALCCLQPRLIRLFAAGKRRAHQPSSAPPPRAHTPCRLRPFHVFVLCRQIHI